tara:strand:+ start:125 stop:805 length:681 start_codon:yes stop_codon:yes gene_type:complete
MFRDKKVAIVGPSSYLEGAKLGSFIDSFDLVVRINNIHDTNNPKLVEDLGAKTDIIYFDGSIDNQRFNTYSSISPKLIKCTYPETEWFFNDRCKANISVLKKYFNTEVIDNNLYNELKSSLSKDLKTRPNSGLIAILDILTYPIKELHITGIDFYRSTYASYHPDYGSSDLDTIKEVFRKGDNGDVHDINKQFKYFKENICLNPKVSMDSILQNYVQDPKFENVTF